MGTCAQCPEAAARTALAQRGGGGRVTGWEMWV